MDEMSRILGSLEEAKRQTDKRFDDLEIKNHQRFENIEKKLDKLWEFRWKIAGGSIVMSVLCLGLVELIHIAMK